MPFANWSILKSEVSDHLYPSMDLMKDVHSTYAKLNTEVAAFLYLEKMIEAKINLFKSS